MACFLGIDLGTSSVKVVVVDETGRVFSKSSERYSIYSPILGGLSRIQRNGGWPLLRQ